MGEWDPTNYDRAWQAMADAGADPHGEVAFIERAIARLGPPMPGPILDAGCGTGRVAIELAGRGYDVVGSDIDESMLAHARAKAPGLGWHLGDLSAIAFPHSFPLVAMAGNVILFVNGPDRAGVVANMARHLDGGGLLIAGFQLQRSDGRRVTIGEWDGWASAAGLIPVERFSTWDDHAFDIRSDYVVTVHRRL